MSLPVIPIVDLDPDGATAIWTRGVDKCVAVCPPPPFRVGFSERTRVFDADTGAPTPFSDWTAYAFGDGSFQSGLYPALNTDPENGGIETQVRARFEIGVNGREGVIRYRQVFRILTGPIGAEYEVLSSGVVHVIDIPADNSSAILTVDFTYEPCSIGQTSILTGPPGGGGDGGYDLERQSAFLRKHGWRQYQGDSPSVKIYRQEAVNSGGDPGCSSSGRLARSYSGTQLYQATTATAGNNYVADPAGHYASSLSPNLIADKHASTPFDQPNATVEFGHVNYPSNDVKSMVEIFDCGGPVAKTLGLVLTNEYTTLELESAVTSALNAQASHSLNVGATDGRVVHRDYLSPFENIYERVRTTKLRWTAGGAFAGIFGSPGEIVRLRGTAELVSRVLAAGGQTTVTVRNFIVIVQANGDRIVGLGGRDPVVLDPDDSSPPEINPFETTAHDGTEVLVRKVTTVPHIMLNAAPFVEDPAVIAIGYDS